MLSLFPDWWRTISQIRGVVVQNIRCPKYKKSKSYIGEVGHGKVLLAGSNTGAFTNTLSSLFMEICLKDVGITIPITYSVTGTQVLVQTLSGNNESSLFSFTFSVFHWYHDTFTYYKWLLIIRLSNQNCSKSPHIACLSSSCSPEKVVSLKPRNSRNRTFTFYVLFMWDCLEGLTG